VGLIPAGGGCKEMLSRYLGDIPEGTEYDSNAFVQQAFKNIALAAVATSAEQARAYGYLRPTDTLTLDPDALIQSAKKAALGLAEGGFVPPHKRRFKLPGAQGRAAIELFLYQMREGGYATPHDLVVSKKLAWVMTGGDVPAGTKKPFHEDVLNPGKIDATGGTFGSCGIGFSEETASTRMRPPSTCCNSSDALPK
jgi:3-hydroxyacyl-CoA dehydrogenase